MAAAAEASWDNSNNSNTGNGSTWASVFGFMWQQLLYKEPHYSCLPGICKHVNV
jgi:hypothetical protein